MFELFSSSLYSVAIESLCFLMVFAMALRYKQWRQADAKPQSSSPAFPQHYGKAARAGNAKAPSSLKNRKAGTRGYLSGESTDTGAGSMRSSDTDVSSSEFLGEPRQMWVAAPGAQQLGFVQYPQAFMMAVDQNGFNSNGMRLNPHAQQFVPSTGNAGQQQEWGYNAECEASWAHLNNTTQGEYQGGNSHSDLAKVINKLSPEDAATVMASLNVAEATPKSMVPVVLYPHPAPMSAPSGNRWESNGHNRGPNTRSKATQPARPALPKEVIEHGSTLKENLRQLSSLDNKCVLLVRKISKLGLNSPQLLEIYFSQFGPVDKVFISHSIEKPQGRRAQPRWRPAALGFIAMKDAKDAEAARARGNEQTVLGHTITVGTYEDHFAAKLAQENSEEKEDGEE